MKKKIGIAVVAMVVAAALILLVPIPKGSYDDGGTREYEALTYKLVRWNRVTADGGYHKTRVYFGKDKHASIDELFAREIADNQPVETAVPFNVQYIRTDGYHEDALYPAVTVIRSKSELFAYYRENEALYNLERRDDPASDSTIGFLDACDRYDAAFFETKSLVLVLLEEPSGSIRHKVTDVYQTDENNLAINIATIVPEVGTDDMAQWHLFVEAEAAIDDESDVVLTFPTAYGSEYIPDREDVVYQNEFAQVILPLPEGWEYEPLDDGIRFYPKGQDGHLRLSYSEAFGVCGTGLHCDTVEIGGFQAERGTYDDHDMWDYIVLPTEWSSVGDYVILNEGADTWWEFFGDDAMNILQGITIHEKVTMEVKAIIFAKQVCTVEYDSVDAAFDADRAVWEIDFYRKDFDGGDQLVTVDGFTGEILEVEYGE